MLQELIANSLKKFTSSATTIDVDKIEQAILLSTLSGQPAHIEGEWWAWKDDVMTKRMLLGVILCATFGFKNAMASTRVCDHYYSIKHVIPEQFWYESSGNQLISSIASRVVGRSNSLDLSVRPMSTESMEQLVKHLFAQEHI